MVGMPTELPLRTVKAAQEFVDAFENPPQSNKKAFTDLLSNLKEKTKKKKKIDHAEIEWLVE